MIDLKNIDQIKQSSIKDRIQLIEFILESIKEDINQIEKINKLPSEPFKVRRFSLGGEVNVDRDILYSERGF